MVRRKPALANRRCAAWFRSAVDNFVRWIARQDRLNRWIGEVPASRAQGKQEENATAQQDDKSETTDNETDRSTRRGVRSPMVGEVLCLLQSNNVTAKSGDAMN